MFRQGLTAGVVLAFSAIPAQAAEWRLAGLEIGSGNRGVTYVDAASVRNIRGKVRFRAEQHLERAANGMDRILSVAEVDCSRMALTILRAQYYRGGGLVGMVSTPREDNVYSSRTSAHWVPRRVCDQEFLSGPVPDRARQAARIFAMDWAPMAERLAVAIPQSQTLTRMASVGSEDGKRGAGR